jgi:ubiquinone/menaquinone biosynthesis C-methylase UbiE
MGLYSDHILPRLNEFALSREPIMAARRRVTQGLQGVVLEIGLGSGLNLPYYPAEVARVLAIEPSAVARQLAQRRVEQCAVPFVWSGLDGQRLALEDASVDSALTTFTLCTIPDLELALGELRRVIRRDGALHFLEHGRSPDRSVARWQDRLNPLQRRIAAGCNLNRDLPQRLRAAGFCLDALDAYYIPGPRIAGYFFEGRARNCG